jgi:hypothetical protein
VCPLLTSTDIGGIHPAFANMDNRLSLHHFSLCLLRRRVLLSMPSWIDADVTTGFLTAMLPIAMVVGF